MNEVVAITQKPKASLIETMARRVSMEPKLFESTVRSTVMPAKHTNEQFAALMLVAHEYGLNPVVKEIYAFPAKGGGIVPIVSIDGWVNLVNSHPQANGFTFDWIHDDEGKLIACTCRMYRKDRDHPVEVTEYLSECKRNTDPWKMAHRMLRHKAMIQAARYAFGFSGIYDEDEGAKIANAEPHHEAEKLVPPAPPEFEQDTNSPPGDDSELPADQPAPERLEGNPEEIFQQAKEWGSNCNDSDDLEIYIDEFGQYLDAMNPQDREHLQSIMDETRQRIEPNIMAAG